MDRDPAKLLEQLPPGVLTCSLVAGFLLWGGFWAVFAALFQRNLAAVPEVHRQMKPGRTWWLVPFPVAFVFLFVVVARISGSWKSLFESRGDSSAGACGRKVGMLSAVCALVSNLLSIQPFLGGGPVVTTVSQLAALLLGIGGFILLIVYVIVINDLKMKATGETRESASDS